MKVSVVGTGYVGLSLAVLISRKHQVIAVDIVKEKAEMINCGKSPISDKEIEEYLASGNLNLNATTDITKCAGSDFVIISTPTNYDPETQYFDTSSVEGVAQQLKEVCPNATVVIKSTVPIGYTEGLYTRLGSKLLFSPEFLREGRALYDNLHPSRIVVGIPMNDVSLKEKGEEFATLLTECSEEPEVKTMITGSTEAESVKLFSNTYLAMRVTFFNELDSFAEQNGLSARDIINGVCMDPRIGNHYNNPSFGYGGYCLPKDTKQLLANYSNVPNDLMGAIVKGNATRKQFIADEITKNVPPGSTIGVYRLTMKSGSDNFRESSIIDVVSLLETKYKIILYEPTVNDDEFRGWEVIKNFEEFEKDADLIVANRADELIKDSNKLFCRDVFGRD